MQPEKIFNNPKMKEKRKKLRANVTNAERLLWIQLKGKAINGYKFRRQHSIGYYVTDFYCPKVNLAVEIDGETHCSDEEIENDKESQGLIENLGIHFLRFTNQEVFEAMDTVIEKIKNKIESLTGI